MAEKQEADPRSFATTYRVLATTMTVAVVAIGLAGTFAVSKIAAPLDRPWLVVLPAGGALLLHLVIERFGYSASPLDHSDDAERRMRRSQMAWQSTSILRLAVAESLGIIGLALAFVSSAGQLVLLWGCVILSALLMILHGQPWRRPVQRLTAALERNGASSPLPEIFHITRADAAGVTHPRN